MPSQTMPPQIGSPPRPSRPKRESSTITRSVGKALADVMNKDKNSRVVLSSTESEPPDNTGSPTRARAGASTKPVMATTRDGSRAPRASLDTPRGSGSDKPTLKLTKRAQPPAKPISRSQASTVPSSSGDNSSKNPGEKSSKARASLTLRGLSSALQPKPSLPPSALPKYKLKSTTELVGNPRPGAKKRHSNWDVDDVQEKDQEEKADDVKSSDDDVDDDFVTVDRPISPLPRRATRKAVLPVSLSLTPSTPQKSRNILTKGSSSLSVSPPHASKSAKTSTTSTSPVARLQVGRPRPPSVASNSSHRATPVQSPRKHAKVTSSTRSAHRRPATADAPSSSSSSKREFSPANPFQLPETSGSSLLSPPLSPFLEGVSIDSLDANDVSAILSSVVSPTKSTHAPSHTTREILPQTHSHHLKVFPGGSNAPPPQTPTSSRSISSFATDPRQSVLSLRQFLENSGDLEHLLSQPLPSILTPDARERLLSFGFSPDVPKPPFPSAALRPEPQTPCPVPDAPRYTSISQILFPSAPTQASTEQQQDPVPDSQTSAITDSDGSLVESLKRKLSAAEGQRTERDAKIDGLEKQLTSLQGAREREAAELSAQVTDLEVKLQGLLDDHEREAERRASETEGRVREKDAEWERRVVTAIAQVHERELANQEHLLNVERRRASIRSAAAAWESAREIACGELEFLRCNRRFIDVILSGLDVSIQQMRQ